MLFISPSYFVAATGCLYKMLSFELLIMRVLVWPHLTHLDFCRDLPSCCTLALTGILSSNGPEGERDEDGRAGSKPGFSVLLWEYFPYGATFVDVMLYCLCDQCLN